MYEGFYKDWKVYKKRFRYYKYMGGTPKEYYTKLFNLFSREYKPKTNTVKSLRLKELRDKAKEKRKLLAEKYN
jgi:hypothetical protein